jgi:hypothetical protein
MNKSIPWLIVIILLVIIIWLTKCKECPNITGRIDTVTKVSYIHDTITLTGKTKIKPVPIPHYIHDTLIDSSGNITIAEIKKYVTNDTFQFLSDSANIIVYTKIYSSNPLDSISNELKANIRHKVIENTITKEIIRKHAFFTGPSLSLGVTSHISLDGLYERNGKVIYKLGVGLNNSIQPVLNAGVYWYISK